MLVTDHLVVEESRRISNRL